LKENVIMGRLIPAGTGMSHTPKAITLKQTVATERKEAQEARQKAAVAALAAIKSDEEINAEEAGLDDETSTVESEA